MSYGKHVCGYPIYVEHNEHEKTWVVEFLDEPGGNRLLHCPGCGGRLVPWEIKLPEKDKPGAEGAKETEEEGPSDLGEILAALVEEAEAALYGLAPTETERWSTLTSQARARLSTSPTPIKPPPWSEDERTRES